MLKGSMNFCLTYFHLKVFISYFFSGRPIHFKVAHSLFKNISSIDLLGNTSFIFNICFYLTMQTFFLNDVRKYNAFFKICIGKKEIEHTLFSYQNTLKNFSIKYIFFFFFPFEKKNYRSAVLEFVFYFSFFYAVKS